MSGLTIEETTTFPKQYDRVSHIALWRRTLKKVLLSVSWLMGKCLGCGGVKDDPGFCEEVVVAFCWREGERETEKERGKRRERGENTLSTVFYHRILHQIEQALDLRRMLLLNTFLSPWSHLGQAGFANGPDSSQDPLRVQQTSWLHLLEDLLRR